jgi:hypothetical protein
MNLFILDRMPVQAARYNCDAHVRKIILESVEMMGYAFDRGRFKPWPWLHSKGRHFNHPMSLWVRRSLQNYDWTLQHGYALSEEFTFRFGKVHKCHEYLDWISANLPLQNLGNSRLTEWPRCFAEYRDTIGISEDVVYDYRRYYMIAKRHLATWTNRPTPEWYR